MSLILPELGTLCLVLALLSASCLVLSPKKATYYVVVQSGFVFAAFLCLMYAFYTDDFTVRYVLQNSSVSLPWFYKLCATWGGHEGSMLLWVLILSAWMCAVAWFQKPLEPEFYSAVQRVMGGLSIGFLLFLLVTSNPFLRQFELLGTKGQDLNPLLQDPGFLFHPPMLYMGYVGFAVPFAMAIAALSLGRIEQSWAKWARPWTVGAWSFLTLGITLGSWWAYRELGWGGYWFWDPVENASFMPWLVGAALLHALCMTEKQGRFSGWTVLLAIMAFSLSLVGTFLVRSGVLTSVHAFAVDPARGLYILLFLMLVVGGSLGLFSLRLNKLKDNQAIMLVSREGGMLMNNVFLTVLMLTVLLGTIYPLIIDSLGLGKLSVGAPYFNAVFVPLVFPMLFIMGIGVHLKSKQDNLKKRLLSLKSILAISLLVPALVFTSFRVYLGIALSLWIVLSTIKLLKSRSITPRLLGMGFAHIGLAVSVLGIALVEGFGAEQDIKLSKGETTTFQSYQVRLASVESKQVQNYEVTRVCLNFSDKFKVCPEKRYYDVSRMVMSEAGIHMGLMQDIYVALGESLDDGAWTLRLMYKPGVRLIWLGGLLILCGGVINLFKRPRAKS